FQAEDGIRDDLVTGVQTCALPISPLPASRAPTAAAYVPAAIVVPRLASSRNVPRAPAARRSVRGWTARPTADGSPLTVSSTAPKIGRASCRERGETQVVAEASAKE